MNQTKQCGWGERQSYRGARWNRHDRYDDREYQLTSPVSLACHVSVGHTGSMLDAISVVMLLLYIHPLSHLPSGTQPKKTTTIIPSEEPQQMMSKYV